jgi:hypothetical protein
MARNLTGLLAKTQSGGQTGADCAAFDVAIEHGIRTAAGKLRRYQWAYPNLDERDLAG